MFPMTCQNIGFVQMGLTRIACCRSSDVSSELFLKKSYVRSDRRSFRSGHTTRKLFWCSNTAKNQLHTTKTTESLAAGVNRDSGRVLKVEKESGKNLVSLGSVFEVVAEDLLSLNENLLNIVGSENPLLMSAAEKIFSAGGKRMRPALVFLASRATAQITGLKELTTEHRRLAEIIEMIHTASLIHDDVIDESDLRRGKETVHQQFGTRVAVLAGDFMFAQSSWYLGNLENLEVIKLVSQVIKDFASGEIKQASSLFDCDIKLEDYLMKSYYKTASLTAASTKGASIFSKVDPKVCEQMFEYGKNLGLSFQIVDDILDFTQSAQQLGKPTGADLVKGNLTAPVIYSLENEPKLRDIIESEFVESGSLDEAINVIMNSGGIDRARFLAQEKANDALQNLQCLPDSAFRVALERMVLYNLERIN